ncbi:unnamed protein product, partial [Gulo gulo]
MLPTTVVRSYDVFHKEFIPKPDNWGTCVAQLLSVCFQLRSWSRGPGIE